jgi:hypothetical protein
MVPSGQRAQRIRSQSAASSGLACRTIHMRHPRCFYRDGWCFPAST